MSHFFYCEAHATQLRNGKGWDQITGQNLLELDGTEVDVDFSTKWASKL